MHELMHGNGPQIVGIAGGSCAGKTWLADQIAEALGTQAVRISLDSFYLDRSHLPLDRRARLNFDHPRAIDWQRFEQVLRKCASRERFAVPRYDFATHARVAGDCVFEGAPVVIVEGLWLFRRAAIRDLFTLKVFLRAPRELCLKRRIDRDTRERGRTREQVLEQMRRQTVPMFERFVAPQQRWADVILEAPVSASELSQLLNRIAEKLCAFGI
jgi:uridine kinase